MTYEEIEKEYKRLLKILAEDSGRTAEEIDAEIEAELKNIDDFDEFLKKASDLI